MISVEWRDLSDQQDPGFVHEPVSFGAANNTEGRHQFYHEIER